MIFWILTKFILSKLYIRILTIKNLHLKTRTPTTLPKLILINKPINNLNKLHFDSSKLPIYSMQRKFSRLIIVLESQERDVSCSTMSISSRLAVPLSISSTDLVRVSCDIRGRRVPKIHRFPDPPVCIPRFPMDPTGTRTRVRYLGRGRKLPRPNTNG